MDRAVEAVSHLRPGWMQTRKGEKKGNIGADFFLGSSTRASCECRGNEISLFLGSHISGAAPTYISNDDAFLSCSCVEGKSTSCFHTASFESSAAMFPLQIVGVSSRPPGTSCYLSCDSLERPHFSDFFFPLD